MQLFGVTSTTAYLCCEKQKISLLNDFALGFSHKSQLPLYRYIGVAVQTFSIVAFMQ